MKSLFATLLAILTLCQSVLATIDGHTRVYIVVQHIQEPELFFVERVPVIGCYGLARGPQLEQFTAEYLAPSNIGCGDFKHTQNINALTCATITDSKLNDDYSSFKEITLDISNCEAKNNPKFITMVRTAAKLNFPLKRGEVRLNLIK